MRIELREQREREEEEEEAVGGGRVPEGRYGREHEAMDLEEQRVLQRVAQRAVLLAFAQRRVLRTSELCARKHSTSTNNSYVVVTISSARRI